MGHQWTGTHNRLIEITDDKILRVNGRELPLSEFPDTIAKEILRLAARDLEHELFAAELISRLGLDREAIDREGLEVGNEILKALDTLHQELRHRKQAIVTIVRRQKELAEKEIGQLYNRLEAFHRTLSARIGLDWDTAGDLVSEKGSIERVLTDALDKELQELSELREFRSKVETCEDEPL